jgi:hypothetical protein
MIVWRKPIRGALGDLNRDVTGLSAGAMDRMSK